MLQDYTVEVLLAASAAGLKASEEAAAAGEGEGEEGVETDGAWKEIIAVTGNHQRRVVHSVQMAGSKIVGLRIQCSKAAGIDEARICEVRAYAVGEDGLFPEKSEAVAFERERLEAARREGLLVDGQGEHGAGASWGEHADSEEFEATQLRLMHASLRAMEKDPWHGPGRLPPIENRPKILRLALPSEEKPFSDGSWKRVIGS